MPTKEKIILSVIGAVIALLGYAILSQPAQKQHNAGDATSPTVLPFNSLSTSSSTITTSSTLIVASSSARQYLSLVNDSSNTVYISFGLPAVSGKGIRLNANGGSYEMFTDQNMFFGAVYGIASGNSNVTVLSSQ